VRLSEHGRDKKCMQNFNGGDHLEGLGIKGLIVLKWILKYGIKLWTGLILLRILYSYMLL
jgi:hypothetical protein